MDYCNVFYPIFVGNSVNNPIRKSLDDAGGIRMVLSLIARVTELSSYTDRLLNHQGWLKYRKVLTNLNGWL
jgi:hypothetical protein